VVVPLSPLVCQMSWRNHRRRGTSASIRHSDLNDRPFVLSADLARISVDVARQWEQPVSTRRPHNWPSGNRWRHRRPCWKTGETHQTAKFNIPRPCHRLWKVVESPLLSLARRPTLSCMWQVSAGRPTIPSPVCGWVGERQSHAGTPAVGRLCWTSTSHARTSS